MLSITYISTATIPFSEQDLRDLLMTSRARNAKLQITGMLLYHPHNFIQTIEGPDAGVLGLLESIKHDLRHKELRVLIRETIQERDFPNWTMGFRNTEALPDAAKSAFNDFLRSSELAEQFFHSERRTHQLHARFSEMLSRA